MVDDTPEPNHEPLRTSLTAAATSESIQQHHAAMPPNSTRPSTLPSICARTVTNTARQQPQQHPNAARAPCRHVLSPAQTAPQNRSCASTPKRMPPRCRRSCRTIPLLHYKLEPVWFSIIWEISARKTGSKRCAKQGNKQTQSHNPTSPLAHKQPNKHKNKQITPLRQHRPQIAKTPAPQNSTCSSTPNCTPYHPTVNLAKLRPHRHLPSTRPSISQECARTVTSTSNSSPNSTP